MEKVIEFVKEERYFRLVIEVSLTKLKANKHAYFSCTGTLYESKNAQYRGRGREIASGCIHDIILKVAPEYKDIISLHLAHEDGEPMYAFDNGYYYLSNPEKYADSVVAKHFRISEDNVKSLRKMDKESLKNWIEEQRPRWQEEADTVRKKYGLLKKIER